MITALLAHWVDTDVILAVVIANAIIGFIQEGKAEQAMGQKGSEAAKEAAELVLRWRLSQLKNTMRRPPRTRHEPLLNGGLFWHIVLVSLLFLCGVFGTYHYAIDRGYSVELARTIALITLVIMEIFHLFFIRNIYSTSLTWQGVRGTKVVWSVVIVITAAQFAITYLPLLQSVFSTESIPLPDDLLIVGVGIALFTIIEIEKQMRLEYQRMRGK